MVLPLWNEDTVNRKPIEESLLRQQPHRSGNQCAPKNIYNRKNAARKPTQRGMTKSYAAYTSENRDKENVFENYASLMCTSGRHQQKNIAANRNTMTDARRDTLPLRTSNHHNSIPVLQKQRAGSLNVHTASHVPSDYACMPKTLHHLVRAKSETTYSTPSDVVKPSTKIAKFSPIYVKGVVALKTRTVSKCDCHISKSPPLTTEMPADSFIMSAEQTKDKEDLQKSVSVPPHMVTNLAKKFNALSERCSQPSMLPINNGRYRMSQKSGAFRDPSDSSVDISGKKPGINLGMMENVSSSQSILSPYKSLSQSRKQPVSITARLPKTSAISISNKKPHTNRSDQIETDIEGEKCTQLPDATPEPASSDANCSRVLSVREAIRNYEVSFLKNSVSSPELQRRQSFPREPRNSSATKLAGARSRTLPTALADVHEFPKGVKSASCAKTLPCSPFRCNATLVGPSGSLLPVAIANTREARGRGRTFAVQDELKTAPVKIAPRLVEPSITNSPTNKPVCEKSVVGKPCQVQVDNERISGVVTHQNMPPALPMMNPPGSLPETEPSRPIFSAKLGSMDLLAEIDSYSSNLNMSACQDQRFKKLSLSSVSSSSSSSSAVPNVSFLWKDSTQTQVQPHLLKRGSSSSVDSFSDSIVNVNCSDKCANMLPTDENDLDEPVYEELFKFTARPAQDFSSSSDNSGSLGKEMLACNSSEQMLMGSLDENNGHEDDEGWIDTSDSDNEESTNSHSASRARPRIKKRGNGAPALMRRSWSQSLRDLASANEELSLGEGGETFASPGSDEGATPDLSPENSEVNDPLNSASAENCNEDPCASFDIEDSVSIRSTESVVNGASKIRITSVKERKVKKVKRHWTWSRTELKLDISSKLDKMRIVTKKENPSSMNSLDISKSLGRSTEMQSNNTLKECNSNAKHSQSKHGNGSQSKSLGHTVSSSQFYVPKCNEGSAVRSNVCDKSAEHLEKPSALCESSLVAAKASNTRASFSKRLSASSTGSAGLLARPKTAPPAPPLVSSSSVQNSLTDTAASEDQLQSDKVSQGSLNHKADICGSPECDRYSSEWGSLFATPASALDKMSVLSDDSSQRLDDISEPDPLDRSIADDLIQRTDAESTREIRIKQLELPSLALLDAQANQFSSKLSPFNDEPLYQFYNAAARLRAVHENQSNDDGQESDPDPYYETIYQMLHGNISEAGLEECEPESSSKTSAMELVRAAGGGMRTLWCEVPEVKSSGVLDALPVQKRRLQEAMFEVITSEASYLKSLIVLVECFAHSPLLCDDYSVDCVLNKRERHVLFSDILPVKETSERLLSDLELRWQESIVISDVCDILLDHATKNFEVYVKYCSNQLYQDRCLKKLKETNAAFVEAIHKIELSPACQQLSLHSFLMLPMQRITRLPLLVDAIFQRLEFGSQQYETCKMALATLNKIVHECNEGAHRMERMEEMLNISHQLDFRECRCLALISASRWLVKRGELFRLLFGDSSSKLSFGRRCAKQSVYLFLFTDLLIITKKKSDDCYNVLDYCPRNLVQAVKIESPEQLPGRSQDGVRNIFQLSMLQNHDNKTVEMFFSCSKESELTRWVEAVTPRKSENPDERIYEEWDCPQVQAIHSYIAQQPDELSLEESDVVNVFHKMADGWYQGERIRDGVQGWFPSNYTVEIVSSHIRARNLRQRYRLLALSHSYVESRRKKEIAKSK